MIKRLPTYALLRAFALTGLLALLPSFGHAQDTRPPAVGWALNRLLTQHAQLGLT